MILFEENKFYTFAKGYYDLAIEKLITIRLNGDWINSWDNESQTKSFNYVNDINRQYIILQKLRDSARD